MLTRSHSGSPTTSASAQAPLDEEILHTSSEKSPSPCVLVVDDEALIRWSLRESLGAAGYNVSEASTARAAIEQFEPGQPAIDAVLLDLWLPDSCDLHLLDEIKRRSPRTQVIVMTAHGTLEIGARACWHGAFRVIAKPFCVDEVAKLVSRAVQSVASAEKRCDETNS